MVRALRLQHERKEKMESEWDMTDRTIEQFGVDVGFEYRDHGNGNSARTLLSIDTLGCSQMFDVWQGEIDSPSRDYGRGAERVNLMVTGEWEAMAVAKGMRHWAEILEKRFGIDDDGEMGNPPLRAAELHEQWVNGNRQDVMRAITSMSSMRAACTVAFMMVLFSKENGSLYDSEADAFISMMQSRLK